MCNQCESPTRNISPPQDENPLSVAYFQTITNAWQSTMLERDKSVLTLSSAGLAAMLGGMVSLATSDKLQTCWWLLPALTALFLFFLCMLWSLNIFRCNAEYLQKAYKREATESDTNSLRAKKDCAVLQLSIAVAFSVLTGIVVIIERHFDAVGSQTLEKDMTNPKISDFPHLINGNSINKRFENIMEFDPRPATFQKPATSTPAPTTPAANPISPAKESEKK